MLELRSNSSTFERDMRWPRWLLRSKRDITAPTFFEILSYVKCSSLPWRRLINNRNVHFIFKGKLWTPCALPEVRVKSRGRVSNIRNRRGGHRSSRLQQYQLPNSQEDRIISSGGDYHRLSTQPVKNRYQHQHRSSKHQLKKNQIRLRRNKRKTRRWTIWLSCGVLSTDQAGINDRINEIDCSAYNMFGWVQD